MLGPELSLWPEQTWRKTVEIMSNKNLTSVDLPSLQQRSLAVNNLRSGRIYEGLGEGQWVRKTIQLNKSNTYLNGFPLPEVWSNVVCPFNHRMFRVANTMLDKKCLIV